MFAKYKIRGYFQHTGIQSFYGVTESLCAGFVTDPLKLCNDRIQSLLEAATTLSPKLHLVYCGQVDFCRVDPIGL